MRTFLFDWDKQRFDLSMSACAQNYLPCAPDYDQCITILFAAVIFTALVRVKLVAKNNEQKLHFSHAHAHAHAHAHESSISGYDEYFSSEDFIDENISPEDILGSTNPAFFNTEDTSVKINNFSTARMALSKM